MIKEGISRLSRHLLYEEAAEKIRELIREKGLWESYLPPERELARLFGVSRDTLRKGLDILAKQKVVARRQGQGTQVLPRPASPQARSTGRVVVGSSHQGPPKSFYGEIMTGLTLGAGEADWSVRFCDLTGPSGRQAFLATLRGREAEGVALISVADRGLVQKVLGLWDGPAVLVDHHFPDLPLTSVIDDSRDGARQATEHLLSLGHRRIAYLDMPDPAGNPWRYSGYVEALRAGGIRTDGDLVVGCPGSFEAGRRAGEELLARPDPPTAALTFDDSRGWGFWRAAEARGLEVGRDFALVGFGDGAAAAGFPEELSSVRVDSRQIGLSAARELGELMAGRAQAGRLLLVPAELVVRKSSRGARA